MDRGEIQRALLNPAVDWESLRIDRSTYDKHIFESADKVRCAVCLTIPSCSPQSEPCASHPLDVLGHRAPVPPGPRLLQKNVSSRLFNDPGVVTQIERELNSITSPSRLGMMWGSPTCPHGPSRRQHLWYRGGGSAPSHSRAEAAGVVGAAGCWMVCGYKDGDKRVTFEEFWEFVLENVQHRAHEQAVATSKSVSLMDISMWGGAEVADWICEIGFPQYRCALPPALPTRLARLCVSQTCDCRKGWIYVCCLPVVHACFCARRGR